MSDSKLIISDLDKHIQSEKDKLVIEFKPDEIELVGEPTVEALAVPDPTMAKIQWVIEKTKALTITDVNDQVGINLVNDARLLKKHMRSAVREWKENSKVDAIKFNKAIDLRFNELTDLLKASEAEDQKKLDDIAAEKQRLEEERLKQEQERYNQRAAGLIKLGMLHDPVENYMRISFDEYPPDGTDPEYTTHEAIIRDEVIRLADGTVLKDLVRDKVMQIVIMIREDNERKEKLRKEAETAQKLKEADEQALCEEKAARLLEQQRIEKEQRDERERELLAKTQELEKQIIEDRTHQLIEMGMRMGVDQQLHLSGITVMPENLCKLDGASFEKLMQQCRDLTSKLSAALEQQVIRPDSVTQVIPEELPAEEPVMKVVTTTTNTEAHQDARMLTVLLDYLSNAPDPVIITQIAKHGMREVSGKLIYVGESLHGLIKELRK